MTYGVGGVGETGGRREGQNEHGFSTWQGEGGRGGCDRKNGRKGGRGKGELGACCISEVKGEGKNRVRLCAERGGIERPWIVS